MFYFYFNIISCLVVVS